MYSDHLTVWLLPYPASTNRLLGMQSEVYSSRCLDPTERGHPTERNNRGSAPACSLQISISSIFAQSTCMRSDVTLRFIQAVLHSVVCKKTFLNLNLRFPVLRIFFRFCHKEDIWDADNVYNWGYHLFWHSGNWAEITSRQPPQWAFAMLCFN